MAIFVSCPYCGGNFQIKEKYAGKKGGCPNCQKLVKVPELPTGDTTQTQGEKPTEAPAPPRARALRPRKALGSANFLEFNCSRCDKLMKSAIKWAGKRTHCTGCGAELKIPALTMRAAGAAASHDQANDLPLSSGEDSSVSDPSSVSLSGHDRDLETLLTEAPLKRNAPAKVRKAQKRTNWSMPSVGIEPYAAFLTFGWLTLLLALVLMFLIEPLTPNLMNIGIVLICTVIISVRMIQIGFTFGGVFCLLFLPLCGPFVAMVSGWRFQQRLNIPGVVHLLTVAMLVNLGYSMIESFQKYGLKNQAGIAAANREVILQEDLSLVEQMGAEYVADFIIYDHVRNVSQEELEQRFRRLAPQLHFRWQMDGVRPVVEVGPIEDLEELVERIDFANVISQDLPLRTVTILVSHKTLNPPSDTSPPGGGAASGAPSLTPRRSATVRPPSTEQTAPANRPAPPATAPQPQTDPISQLLEQATSRQPTKRREALQQLIDIDLAETAARRDDIIQLGCQSLTDIDKETRYLGFTLLQKMQVDAPALTEALKRVADAESFVIRHDVFLFLVEIGTPQAAAVIADHLEWDSLAAIEALIQMGQVAEAAARASLQHEDDSVRRGACQVLEKIGTAASLESLAALREDPALGMRPAAERAYRAIQSRTPEGAFSPRG